MSHATFVTLAAERGYPAPTDPAPPRARPRPAPPPPPPGVRLGLQLFISVRLVFPVVSVALPLLFRNPDLSDGRPP